MVTLPCCGMEGQDVQRVVVSRPVASRPSFSVFTTSYTELLAGAMDDSPPSASPGNMNTTFAIRPKTVRLKPSVNRCPTAGLQSEATGAATKATPTGPFSSGKDPKAEKGSSVVYRPSAKLVSVETMTFLANTGKYDHNHLAPSNDGVLKSTQSQEEPETVPPRPTLQNEDQDNTIISPHIGRERLSFDGYNWRKYGQKQVKGSEYPRSYYKCTHPNCPVKKKVERSLDGKIAEAVYKGDHNHLKLQPPKHTSSESEGRPHLSDVPGRDNCNPQWSHFHGEENGENEGKMEKHTEAASWENDHSNLRKPSSSQDPMKNLLNIGSESHDNLCGHSEECDTRREEEDENDEEPANKRRRKEKKITEIGAGQDPLAVAQSNAELEILEDGFRWRKYGQKVVKGNPYPRSYYRCTNLKCNVRKHIERSLTDPTALVTTYEGKHNHEMPGT